MTQRIAYVTGGMGGIGTAICQRLAKDGFKVVAGCGQFGVHARGPIRPARVLVNHLDRRRQLDRGSRIINAIAAAAEDLLGRADLARDDVDVVLVEIGGTVGDIESLPFLEAIRQFRQDVGREVDYCHTFFEVADGGALAFFQYADDEVWEKNKAIFPESGGTWHVAFKVSKPWLDAAAGRLTKEAIPYRVTDHGYCLSMYTATPDGLRLEFTVDAPDAGHADQSQRCVGSSWARNTLMRSSSSTSPMTAANSVGVPGSAPVTRRWRATWPRTRFTITLPTRPARPSTFTATVRSRLPAGMPRAR